MGSSGGSSGGGGITGLQAAQYSLRGVLDLSAYGFVTASGDPAVFNSTSTINGQNWYTRLWVPAGQPVAGLWLAIGSAGVHDGVTNGNQLALYDDAGNLTDTIPADNTYWATAGWRGAALSGGTIAAQTTGRLIYVAAMIRGYGGTPPGLAFATNAVDRAYQYTGPATTRRRTFFTGSTGTFPATIDPTATGSVTGFAFLLGIT